MKNSYLNKVMVQPASHLHVVDAAAAHGVGRVGRDALADGAHRLHGRVLRRQKLPGSFRLRLHLRQMGSKENLFSQPQQ